MKSFTIQLSARERIELLKPLNGSGGYQSFMGKLRNQLRPGNRLRLYKEDWERIGRYADGYGSGGYQGRIKRLFGRHMEW